MAYKKVIGNYQSNSDFSPDLVGFQITEGSPLMTLTNFYTTPTTSTKNSLFYATEGFAQPVTLSDLNLTSLQGAQLLNNNLNLVLNLNESDLFHYTLFGSLREHIKSSIKKVIINWPASLFINRIASGGTTFTAIKYVYNNVTNSSSFQIPIGNVTNKFFINLDNVPNNYQSTPGKKSMANNFYNYVVNYPIATATTITNSPGYYSAHQEFNVIGFTGLTPQSQGYISIKVKGNPFTGATNGAIMQNFHIKPQVNVRETYFNRLKGLDRFLLNRDFYPIYTSEFTVPVKGNDETFTDVKRKFTWPVSDGYNIDIDTTLYADYLSALLELSDIYDDYKTDLVARFFTTDSIKEFDTSDKRVEKLLRIYGREFDEVKRYIDGIAFASRVSYDKNDNIPDKLIKNFARTLGFETLDFASQENILEAFLGGTNNPVFSGTSIGMTPVEFDIELWRRLVLNAGYLFRAKGTRKVIEFFLRFIGAPDSLIEFNEYVYTVKEKLDISKVETALAYLDSSGGEDNENNNFDTTYYPIDKEGYPKVLRNTEEYYFQMQGGWYRETNFIGANNPHFGPYDGGQAYFNKFRRFSESTGGTYSIPSVVSGTVPENELVPLLVSNGASTLNFQYITNNLGYVNSLEAATPGLGTTWSTVSDAITLGPAAVYVFEHIDESIPADKQNLAKALYDAGYAVLTIGNYATSSLFPISDTLIHNSGVPWGFEQNPFVDPLNPLTQGWTNTASLNTTDGVDITTAGSDSTIISYNAIPNNDKINVVSLYNVNGGRWIHCQNPNLFNSPSLFTNIMDFLTMRNESNRYYFDFDWSEFYEQNLVMGSPGFVLYPQIDNKKSWVNQSGTTINSQREWALTKSQVSSTTTTRDTTYFVGDDERLVLNTKMVDSHLNMAKAIETDMYNYNKLSGFPITIKYDYNPNVHENLWPVVGENVATSRGYNRQNLGTNMYYGSSMSGSGFAVSATTFAQYLDKVKTEFINVKNRKTIGGGGFGFQPNWPAYPLLRNLFESYVSGGTSSNTSTAIPNPPVPVALNYGSNQLTYKRMLGFVKKIQPYWSRLLEQFIPATTIIGMGTKHSNTVFDRQKFVYKHGQRSVIDMDSTNNQELDSQWYKKHRFIAVGIGPCDAGTPTTEPLTLRDNDGSNVIGNAGCGTAASVLVVGKEYYFRIGTRFMSGEDGLLPNQQRSYSIGGSIGDPLNNGGCAGNTTVGMTAIGFAERQGKIYLKTAISGSKDVEILVFGPGFYDVRFTPQAGANNLLQISTDINGLIIESIKLYNVTDSTYIVDNNTRNGNFTEGLEYESYGTMTQSRLRYWSGLSCSGAPAASTKKWEIEASPIYIWPGTDGTESVTLGTDWYCEGILPHCGQA